MAGEARPEPPEASPKITPDLIVGNIGELLVCPPTPGAGLGLIPNGVVAVLDGVVAWVGPASAASEALAVGPTTRMLNAEGRVVMPGLVECHTHLAFAGSRAHEFQARVAGWSYAEIAAGGGGIMSTVRMTRSVSRQQLMLVAHQRLNAMLDYGITTVEAKSGYGLTTVDELRLLELYRELNRSHDVDVLATFMGAHTIPLEHREDPGAYMDLVVEEMLPQVAERGLARYCDVFCEPGFFDLEQSRRVLEKARELGMQLLIHADQLQQAGGAELAAELGVLGASHLDHVDEDGISALAEAGVVAQLLPGATFFLGHTVYAPARRLLEKGVRVALSTDFNPGTCYTENLWLMGTIASCSMHMDITEVVRAMTCEAAASLGLSGRVGTLEVGARADLLILTTDDHMDIPYHFGINPVRQVMKDGVVVVDRRKRDGYPVAPGAARRWA